MLKNLSIKNFAIIEDMNLNFNQGFTVMTGETGAGKSIIIEAINLILGSRANNSMIKDGCEKSYLSATFSINNQVSNFLDNQNIDYDDTLEIVRILNVNGKSSFKINGTTINLAEVAKIRDLLIEIKRQSDNDISSDELFALKIIDRYAEISNLEIFKEYSEVYSKYTELKQKISKIKNSTNNIDVEYLHMQLRRIHDLDVYEGELEELINKALIYNNSFKVSELSTNLTSDLDSMYELSSKIKNNVASLNELGVVTNDYNEIHILLEDYLNSININVDSVSENEISSIEERIFNIKKIYDLYGGSYETLRDAFNELDEQIYNYENGEQLLIQYEQQLADILEKLTAIASNLNDIRAKKAAEIASNVDVILSELYMEDASIEFDFIETDFSIYGNVLVNILISTNGNAFWPINNIASGGERARIILALKKILVDGSAISTIVFDEVDTGVSGRVALAMGKLMKEISRSTQVIAITHLPQVASLGDFYLQVEKSKEDLNVVSNVGYVNDEDKVVAIAKLLSGENISDEALSNAKLLIKEANNV